MDKNTNTIIDYTVFNDKAINELTKIIALKYKDKAIVILEFLEKKIDDLVMKKDLINLFTTALLTTNKCIESLENIGAITYQETGTSYFYKITPIGNKVLSNLKNQY